MGRKANGRPVGGIRWNSSTGKAASCPVGGTLTVICGTGKFAGRGPVVNAWSGPEVKKPVANSSQCIRYCVDGSMPATRKFALLCEQGTALVVLETCAPFCLNRTRMQCPAVHGPALNKATKGCAPSRSQHGSEQDGRI